MGFLFKQKLYEAVPLWIKQSACSVPFGWIAGKAYREVFDRGMWFDKAIREDLLNYQEKKLGEMLQFIAEQVPAYQNLKCVVERMNPFKALKAFPLLDKDTVQANQRDYLPRDLRLNSEVC